MEGAWLAAGHFAAGALMLLLAAALLWLDAASRPVRAFVAFLVLRAGIIVASRIASLSAAWVGEVLARVVVYYEIAVLGAILWFLSVYPRRRGLMRMRGGFVAIVAATLVPILLYAVSPCSVYCEPTTFGPLALLLIGVPLPAAVAAVVLLRDALRFPRGMQRASAALLATAFLVEAALGGGRSVGFLVERALAPAGSQTPLWLTLAPLAFALVAIGRFATGARAAPRIVLPALGLAAAAFLSAGAAVLLRSVTTEVLIGLWRLVLPLLAAYALARHRLFDVDLKVRLAVKPATIGAIFAGVFFVVTEGAAYALGNYLGVLAGIVSVGALVPFIAPLWRAADRLAAMLPGEGVAPPELPIERRREIYYDFAKQAWSDGAMARPERAFLDELRQRLLLPAEDALRLESEAAAGTASMEGST